MKQIFFDVETSGLSEFQNGIWQFGAQVYVAGKLAEEVNLKANIFSHQQWHPVARDMCPHTDEEIETWDKAPVLYDNIETLCKSYVNPFDPSDKFHLYGYNVQFDERFLRQLFSNVGNKYFGSYFWKPAIDVMSLAGEHLSKQRPSMPDFKLATVAEKLGLEVDPDQVHDALYDIKLTKRIYDIVTS